MNRMMTLIATTQNAAEERKLYVVETFNMVAGHKNRFAGIIGIRQPNGSFAEAAGELSFPSRRAGLKWVRELARSRAPAGMTAPE